MAHRNKNLLEAFSASAASERSAHEAEHRDAASHPGGPFATPPSQESILTPAERELIKEASSGPPAFARALLRPENYPGAVAVVVLLVGISFLLGRASVRGVAAAEPDAPTASAPAETESAALASDPIPLPGASVPVQRRTSADGDRAETESATQQSEISRQLLDLNNRYTVKLVEYQRDRDEHLANPTYYYLIDQGLPAAMLYRGKRLIIVLGAAREQVELDSLLQQAKTMRGPPPNNKRAEFSDAYVDKIDNYLDRE